MLEDAGATSLLPCAFSEVLAEKRHHIGVEPPMKIDAVETRRVRASGGVGLHLLRGAGSKEGEVSGVCH